MFYLFSNSEVHALLKKIFSKLTSRPIFRRKLSDIQVPAFSTVTTTNQLITNSINLVNSSASPTNSNTVNNAAPSNNTIAYFENNMTSAAISNPGTNANSSFDSDTNFDSNGSNAKFLSQTFSPVLSQFQTGTNLLISHPSADSFSNSNISACNASSNVLPYGNNGSNQILGNQQMMNHLVENNVAIGNMNFAQPSTISNSNSER